MTLTFAEPEVIHIVVREGIGLRFRYLTVREESPHRRTRRRATRIAGVEERNDGSANLSELGIRREVGGRTPVVAPHGLEQGIITDVDQFDRTGCGAESDARLRVHRRVP